MRNRSTGFIYVVCLFALTFAFCENSRAQDLEPGSLSAVPIGGNFAIASTGYSSGNILLDNSIPVEDLKAQINSFGLGYASSFKLFNKVSKFDVVLPYALADFNALVEGEAAQASRNGLGDPLLRFSIILLGVEPLKPADFFKSEPSKFKLGASFRVQVPLGQYDPTKLLNLGTNRWSFKVGLAGSYTIKNKLIFEMHLNSWLFTDNNNYNDGNTQSQSPLLGSQLHSTYVFKPGVWLAVSVGRVFGGNIEINGVDQDITTNNGRYGLAGAYRINKNHSLKAAFTNGFITRSGADFHTVILVYQFMWFNKK